MTVPEGLSELLEEFAVTVLREKPKDLLEFAASYFHDLNMSKKRARGGASEKASTTTTTVEVEMGGQGWLGCGLSDTIVNKPALKLCSLKILLVCVVTVFLVAC